MIKILLCDPHWATRTGLGAALRRQDGLQIAGEAETAVEAAGLIPLVEPDVILTDARLSGTDADAVTRLLLERSAAPEPYPRPRVLLMIDVWNDSVLPALRAGAAGVLLKSAEVGEFVRAVEVVHRGLPFMAPEALRHLIDWLCGRAPFHLDALTSRETEVLRLVGQGMSNAEISHQLNVQETTVKYHISSVIRKIGVRDRLQAAVFAHRNGIVAWG